MSTILAPQSIAADEVWAQAALQIQEQQNRERAFAAQVWQDLLEYPGYFPAAVARTAELREQHRDRPHWSWAAERWAALMAEGGLTAVLRLLEAPEENQEMLSASPFALMRRPLPVNDFYVDHEPA